MFYRPEDGHGLPHNPFKAIVSPRPIGWISTRGPLGDNLAPYSFFNAVADDPPQVMFAGGLKDTIRNVEASGVFAVNLVEAASLHAMNATSKAYSRGTDEFLAAKVAKAECQSIACPRVANAPATLECRMTRVMTLPGEDNFMVIGTVTGVHLRPDCLSRGRFDVTLFQPLSRLGYRDYAAVEAVFALSRPDD
jgi:flavin reductase (DIM6/NTAB) family NADH-FMN oxidoreductase RutF